jgi:hypothetical protein
MSAFEPLVRIARTAFPYWLILLVLVSVLAGFISRRKEKKPFVVSALLQGAITCAFLFMVLGIYVQLTSSPISFVDLLPSSFLVASVVALSSSAALLIFSRSEAEDAHPAVAIVGVVLITVFVGVFLAIVVSVFPKVILWQWHLLKRL